MLLKRVRQGVLIFVLSMMTCQAFGQQVGPSVASPAPFNQERPAGFTQELLPLDQVQRLEMPGIDLVAVRLEDEARDLKGLPPRFAMPNSVNITPDTGGLWERLDEQTLVWRLRIICPGALSINLGFTKYFMPAGGGLFLYAADGSYVVGPHTEKDNAESGDLWTAVVLGSDIMVEVAIPEAALGELQLVLTSINHGYRFFGEKHGDDSPRAGACNIDVICPSADAWRNEIPAIGDYTVNGLWTCSGSMINNTAQDQTPYFLTANHCGVDSSNASTMVVYWNFYSPTCGAHGGGSLSTYQTGATWRASFGTSDVTLVQLNSMPQSSWGITYAGWDRNGLNPPTGAGIHHPSNDEKSITFFDSLYHPSHGSSWGCSPYPGPGDNTHIRVYWNAADGAVTEPGSSGSPLFDNNHRIIGQLHGGPSFCGATGDSLSDCYGRFSVSWTGGGTSSSRLSNWLDSAGTGATSVNTFNPAAVGLAVTPSDGLISSGGTGGPFSPGSKVYTLTNQGTSSINYTIAKTQAWVTLSSTGGTLAGGANTNITVSINASAESLAAGSYSDTVTFTNTTSHIGDTTRPVSLQVIAPSLVVTPAGGLSSSGSVGGPFTPSNIVYTLQNPGFSSINYTVAKTQTWVTLSSTGGTLAGGASTNITVSINAGADSLVVGSYSDTVTFTNTTNHIGDTTRPVSLQVNPLSNDLCANAIVACPGTAYTGTTADKTRDGTASCGSSSTTADAWYKYTPGSSGSATFSLCGSGTTYDSVLSVHTGTCPGTAQAGCDDDTCGTVGGPSTVTATVTAGITYLIRVSGYSGATGPYSLTITGPACPSADTTPPTPNPMTFASPPAPTGTTSIAMTATTATDAGSPPVSYYFNFVSGGSGGNDSAWQLAPTSSFTDSGLTANTGYTYRVKARDSAATPNETTYSSNAATATYIETPTGVTFGTTTTNSVVLNAAGTFTNLTVSSSGVWFDSTTAGGDGGINAWVQATTDTATGLTANTLYTFQAKARNQSSAETAYTTPANQTTLIETPTGVSFGTVTSNSVVLNATGTLTNLTVGSSGVWFDSTTAGGDGGINAWVQTTTDTATGLTANTLYTFQAKARNQSAVETPYSGTASKWTLALVPAAPTLGSPTTTTMTLNVNPNGNPAATTFAIRCTAANPADATWASQYVDALGHPSATAVWQTDAAWGTITVNGLQPNTMYTFAVKARNGDLVETAFGPGADLATLPLPTGACCNPGTGACTIVTQAACGVAGGVYQGNDTSCTPNPCAQPCVLPGDINVDGAVNGLDIAGFVRAKLGQTPLPGENPVCADYGHGGDLNADIADFVAGLLG